MDGTGAGGLFLRLLCDAIKCGVDGPLTSECVMDLTMHLGPHLNEPSAVRVLGEEPPPLNHLGKVNEPPAKSVLTAREEGLTGPRTQEAVGCESPRM